MPEPIVTLNEESLRSDLRELVGKTVGDTLDGLLEAEADELVGTERHGRAAGREAHRAGYCDRGPTTSSGEVTIRMPELKGARFTTAIIERHRRREPSVEEAMMEMCLAGIPTRGIEDVPEILRGPGVSAATASNLSGRAFASVEERRSRPLERARPYVCVDGIHLKRSRGGACESVAVMVAVGVDDDGCREAIGAAEAKALAVAEELDGMRLGEEARVVREGLSETLAHTASPASAGAASASITPSSA